MVGVLNAGYVELVESMGGDQAVIRNSRRCWRSEDKSAPDADQRLIRHLLAKEHMSPFEACVMTFDIKAPLFIARQWFRHRIGSYMEESLRYCIAKPEYYVPEGLSGAVYDDWCQDMEGQWEVYQHYLDSGMPREQARALLPMGTYTKWYWTTNLRTLLHFLELRLDKAAQAEMREYAKAVLGLTRQVSPITIDEWEALR